MAEEALTLNSDGLIRDHGILTGLPPECALLDSGGGQESAVMEETECAIEYISMNDIQNQELANVDQ
jgi:hypothetical protein